MSYDRRWLEPVGSEDSHGRTLWALANAAPRTPIRRAAAGRGDCSRPHWPRSSIHLAACLGLYAARTRRLLRDEARRSRGRPFAPRAGGPADGLASGQTGASWRWFENVLAYDNARLPQALIETGLATETDCLYRSRPRIRCVGSWQCRPRLLDASGRSGPRVRQDPRDAGNVRSAARRRGSNNLGLPCRGARGSAEWPAGAMRAFDWFLGANDLELHWSIATGAMPRRAPRGSTQPEQGGRVRVVLPVGAG